MDLDRGMLAKIDRKLLAGLGDDEAYRTVRVPATAAKWSTWKRYCDSAGISIGRAIMALIDRELISVFGESDDGDMPVFGGEAEQRLAAREAQIAARERGLDEVDGRLGEWTERLRLWEDEVRNREQQIGSVTKLEVRPRASHQKVGRSERCPCGSELRYKHCHGLLGR